jgi:hypothetical protein
VTDDAPPAPEASAASDGFKSGRGGAVVTPEAIQRGIVARHEQSTFNAYVNATAREPARLRKDRERVKAITETLERGTEVRKVAQWVGKGTARKRAGEREKAVKILPAKKLALMAERSEAEARIKIAESESRVSPEVRAEFLKILPAFAARKGYDRTMLIAAGVPEADVQAARIK